MSEPVSEQETIEARVARMNVLFAAHDAAFAALGAAASATIHEMRRDRARALDAAAQRIRAGLVADGVNLVHDKRGFFSVKQKAQP